MRHSDFALNNGTVRLVLDGPADHDTLSQLMAEGSRLAYAVLEPEIEALPIIAVSSSDCDYAAVSVKAVLDPRADMPTFVSIEITYWHRVSEKLLDVLAHRYLDLLLHVARKLPWTPEDAAEHATDASQHTGNFPVQRPSLSELLVSTGIADVEVPDVI